MHPSAEAELDAAVSYYEGEQAGLGLDLNEEVFAALKRIQQNPLAFLQVNQQGGSALSGESVPLLGFFLEFEDHIWIAAVAHQKRRPGYWSRRKAR
jgi:hypothetical protein